MHYILMIQFVLKSVLYKCNLIIYINILLSNYKIFLFLFISFKVKECILNFNSISSLIFKIMVTLSILSFGFQVY
jgi:hypothetical protein